MKPGDTVICRDASGYAFTEGKEYTLINIQPAGKSDPESWFTWPGYVEVLNDYDRQVHCHAHRFIPKE